MKTVISALSLLGSLVAVSAFANDPQPIRNFTPQESIADVARLVDFAQDIRNCESSDRQPQVTVHQVLMYSDAKIKSVNVNSAVSAPRITFHFTNGRVITYQCRDLVTLGLGF